MAEELAGEERLGQPGGIDGDERLVGAAAPPMNGARDELLAAAGLALDQHGRVHPRDVSNLLVDDVHRGAASDEAVRPLDAARPRALRPTPR